MALRRLAPAVVLLLAAASSASASRLLLQHKGKGIQGTTLAAVQQASYVTPALGAFVEPLWVPPVAPEPAIRRPWFPRPAVAPMAAPTISPVAQPPIYASGTALPIPPPLVIPKKEWYKIPYLYEIGRYLTLGIRVVELPDPVQVAPPRPTIVSPSGVNYGAPAMPAAPAMLPPAMLPAGNATLLPAYNGTLLQGQGYNAGAQAALLAAQQAYLAGQPLMPGQAAYLPGQQQAYLPGQPLVPGQAAYLPGQQQAYLPAGQQALAPGQAAYLPGQQQAAVLPQQQQLLAGQQQAIAAVPPAASG